MHTLPELPYDYDALAPAIDEQTMRIHHGKHHQGYVNKLNAALEGHADLAELSVEELLADINQVPAEIQTAVKNNGGGHANHSLFWSVLSPEGGGEPTADLAAAIDESFNDFKTFKTEFETTASGQFGSGWGWLVVTADGTLDIISTPNQDSPLMTNKTPIFGVDVWEHAYYLNYQNERGSYLSSIWDIVDWDAVAERYAAAVA